MTILKLALIALLRIVLMGSLKLALFIYAICLSDTNFCESIAEGKGYVGENTSRAVSEGDHGYIGHAAPNIVIHPR